MKKIIGLITALVLLVSSAAMAESIDFSKLSDEEVTALYLYAWREAGERGLEIDPLYDPTPSPDVYTAKAWPFIQESYADILENTEERIGQVYVLKGTVQEVLSGNPLRVVFLAGEEGMTMPVVVERPWNRKFALEEGKEYRIYADLTSVADGRPVMTARYVYAGMTAGN